MWILEALMSLMQSSNAKAAEAAQAAAESRHAPAANHVSVAPQAQRALKFYVSR